MQTYNCKIAIIDTISPGFIQLPANLDTDAVTLIARQLNARIKYVRHGLRTVQA
jgi:hypothetical protein